METTASGPKSLWGHIATLFVILGGFPLGSAVQLAIVPSMTDMAAYFSAGAEDSMLGHLMSIFGVKVDGAFISQIVTTLPTITLFVGAPIMGWLAGRVGKRPIMLACALIYAIDGAAGAIAPNLLTLLLSRLILGLMSAGSITIGLTLISDYYTGKTRDRLMGFAFVCGTGGALVSLLIAGPIAEYGGWRAPFAIYLIDLPIFAVAIFAIREPIRAVGSATAKSSGLTAGALGVCLLSMVIGLISYTVTLNGVFLLASKGIASQTVQSAIVDVSIAGSVVAAASFGLIRPKLGFLGVLFVTWLALVVGIFGFGLVDGIFLLCVTGFLVGAGGGFVSPLTTAAIVNTVTPEAASMAVGLNMGCIFLGQFLHPFVCAPIREAFGVDGPFMWMGAASVVGLAVTALFQIKGALRRPALSL